MDEQPVDQPSTKFREWFFRSVIIAAVAHAGLSMTISHEYATFRQIFLGAFALLIACGFLLLGKTKPTLPNENTTLWTVGSLCWGVIFAMFVFGKLA